MCFAKNQVCGSGGFKISKPCCSGLKCEVFSQWTGEMRCKAVNPFDLGSLAEPATMVEEVQKDSLSNAVDPDDIVVSSHQVGFESMCFAKNQVCGSGGFKISKPCCSGLKCEVFSQWTGEMRCKSVSPFDFGSFAEPATQKVDEEAQAYEADVLEQGKTWSSLRG